MLSSYFHTTTISNQKDQLPWETNHWLNFFFSHFWQFSNIVPDNRSRKKNSTILCEQLQLMICKIDTIVAIYMCSYFNIRNVFFDMIFLNLSKNSIFSEIYIIKQGQQPSMPILSKKFLSLDAIWCSELWYKQDCNKCIVKREDEDFTQM